MTKFSFAVISNLALHTDAIKDNVSWLNGRTTLHNHFLALSLNNYLYIYTFKVLNVLLGIPLQIIAGEG